jgi:hypothetical protein
MNFRTVSRHISGALIALVVLLAVGARAQTNTLSDAEVQGRDLARQILELHPLTNFTQAGTLKYSNANKHKFEFLFECRTLVWPGTWDSIYNITTTNDCKTSKLLIHHFDQQRNRYEYPHHLLNEVPGLSIGVGAEGTNDSDSNIRSVQFAGTDFWITDLGLEFFHWPAQKILKHEVRRSRGCAVLESTNPSPATNGYSRVVSWIDEESLGIVQAYAYDARGKKLKEFYPKDFKKDANSQWQVGMMEMDNVQTKSRSRIEFDLKK